jgi:hypothetical protein
MGGILGRKKRKRPASLEAGRLLLSAKQTKGCRMYTIKTENMMVEQWCAQLDPIELLMLGRIFQSARERVRRTVLRGLISEDVGDTVVDDLTSVMFDTVMSCVVRCRRISSAKEFLVFMPTDDEWKREK